MPSEIPPIKREEAALLLAQGSLTHEQIAENVGVSRQTLYNWKKEPEFQALIEAEERRLVDAMRSFGIAKRVNRMQAIQDRWDRLKCVIVERSQDPDMQRAPGGPTGLLSKDVKMIGSGLNAKEVDIYSLDTGLLSAMTTLENQAAEELGQKVQKNETTAALTFTPGPSADWFNFVPPPPDAPEGTPVQDPQAG